MWRCVNVHWYGHSFCTYLCVCVSVLLLWGQNDRAEDLEDVGEDLDEGIEEDVAAPDDNDEDEFQGFAAGAISAAPQTSAEEEIGYDGVSLM